MQRVFILSLFMACIPFMSAAASHGHGHVQIQGAIIDTACAIATGEADQGISMGTLAFSELENNGRGPSVPLSISLVNCVLNGASTHNKQHWKDVRITFDGEADGARRFALQGSALGESLVIADSRGNEAEPGKPMPTTPIVPGNMTLHYQLWLTRNDKKIRPGKFNTTIRYFMEYD